MSEKKRTRRRKDEYSGPGEHDVEKPSKDEYKVAKWMKKNLKSKKTKFLNHNVQYFTATRAVDALMKSKFAEGDGALFSTREQVIEFLDVMLEHNFFHRAKKVPVSIEEIRGTQKGSTATKKDEKKDDKDKASKKEQKEKEEKKDTEGEAEAEASGTNGAEETAGGAGTAGEKQKEKRKRKIRLEMHPEQLFVDGSEAYVWIYDPIPLYYWIYGLILLLGAIGVCLFPLWPPLLRKGVYYLSIAAAGFLVFILALTVVRLIIFTIVWALSGGKLHFWMFPNLTEDVGFFASFWPLYETKYVADTEKTKRSKSKSKKKAKDSDAEDDAVNDDVPIEPEKIEEIKEHDADVLLRHRNVQSNDDGDSLNASDGGPTQGDTEEESHSSSGGDNSEAAAESDAKGSGSASESESEISGKDYEIISTSEVQNVK